MAAWDRPALPDLPTVPVLKLPPDPFPAAVFSLRTRSTGTTFPFSSPTPLCSVARLNPVARDNLAMPPMAQQLGIRGG